MMGFRRTMQTVHCFCGHRHSRIETKSTFRTGQVVINGFRYPYHVHTALP